MNSTVQGQMDVPAGSSIQDTSAQDLIDYRCDLQKAEAVIIASEFAIEAKNRALMAAGKHFLGFTGVTPAYISSALAIEVPRK